MDENGKKNISAANNGKSSQSLLGRLVSAEIEDEKEAKAGYLRGFFLIKRIEIEEALREGFGKKRIWAILNRDGEFPGSYSSFLKLIQTHIPSQKESNGKVGSKETASGENIPVVVPRKKLTRPEGNGEKNFNPRPLSKDEIW